MSGVQLNAEQFYSRITALHGHWLTNKDTDWGGADAVVITAGKGEEEQTVYWVSVAAQLYLFDVELPESVLILTKDALHFFGSSSKIKKL